MKLNWRTELPQWLLLAGMFVLALMSWSALPDRLPIHFGMNGEADGWGGKFEALLLLPLIATGTYLLMAFLPRLDPGGPNYARFQGAYAVIRTSAIAMLAVVYGLIHLAFRSGKPRLDQTALPLVVGALLIVLGNQMGKIRPNWFVGVRTPWTLSSKLAWVKTHRFAGWVLVVSGIVLLVAGAIGRQEMVLSAAVIGVAGTLAAAAYSYFVWKSDPNKVPPAGTLPADEAGGDVAPRS